MKTLEVTGGRDATNWAGYKYFAERTLPGGARLEMYSKYIPASGPEHPAEIAYISFLNGRLYDAWRERPDDWMPDRLK